MTFSLPLTSCLRKLPIIEKTHLYINYCGQHCNDLNIKGLALMKGTGQPCPTEQTQLGLCSTSYDLFDEVDYWMGDPLGKSLGFSRIGPRQNPVFTNISHKTKYPNKIMALPVTTSYIPRIRFATGTRTFLNAISK